MTEFGNERRVLSEDFPLHLRKKIGVSIGWALADLGDEISNSSVCDQGWKYEQFARDRTSCVQVAIARVCQDNNVPHTFDRLKVNGQRKLLVRLGRVVLIVEAMKSNRHHPVAADYKRELASSRNASRQLILPFREWENEVFDMSGEILATLLFGTTGSPFQDHRMGLNRLQLAVPDREYRNWLVKEDLTSLAIQGEIVSADSLAENDRTTSKTWVIKKRSNAQKKENK